MATRISHKCQLLLDDGNRIIIPQENFKILKDGNKRFVHRNELGGRLVLHISTSQHNR